MEVETDRSSQNDALQLLYFPLLTKNGLKPEFSSLALSAGRVLSTVGILTSESRSYSPPNPPPPRAFVAIKWLSVGLWSLWSVVYWPSEYIFSFGSFCVPLLNICPEVSLFAFRLAEDRGPEATGAAPSGWAGHTGQQTGRAGPRPRRPGERVSPFLYPPAKSFFEPRSVLRFARHEGFEVIFVGQNKVQATCRVPPEAGQKQYGGEVDPFLV